VFDGFPGQGGDLNGIAGGAGSLEGGGGGAAVAPAIFVRRGSVTTVNCTFNQMVATGGPGGVGGQGGQADSTPIFNHEGMVNGSSTPGPVPN
jgi:hypothetical protein